MTRGCLGLAVGSCNTTTRPGGGMVTGGTEPRRMAEINANSLDRYINVISTLWYGQYF